MSDETRSRRLAIAAAVAVGLVALGIRLWAFGGLTFGIGFDDGRYATVAQNLANGFLPAGDGEWFGTRVVLLWPIAALFRVFGASDYSAVAWPLIGSLVGVLAAGLVGRELAGGRVGLVAAAIMAVVPIEVLFATRLRPDSWMPALIGMSIWAALRARSSDRRLAWALAAGALLGAAWSVRESAPVMAPVIGVALWPAGRRALAAGAAGAIAVPIICGALFAAVGGSFAQPLTSTAGTAVWRNPITAWSDNRAYIDRLWDEALQWRSLFFLLLPTMVIAVGLLAWRRERKALLPALWLAWAALYLEVGTLVNVAKPVRYLTLVAIPAALLVALAIDSKWAAALPAALAVIAIGALAPLAEREHRADDVVLLNRVAERLRELPRGPVLSENYTWHAKLRVFLTEERVPVARVLEPTYLSAAERRQARILRPLPALADYVGGYVVEAPIARRSGWPLNWGIARRRMQRQIPREELRLVAQVGTARILHWPAGIAPLPDGTVPTAPPGGLP